MPIFNINNIDDFVPKHIDQTDSLTMQITKEYVKKKELAFMDFLNRMEYEVRFDEDGKLSVYFLWTNERASDRLVNQLWNAFNSLQYPKITEFIRSVD